MRTLYERAFFTISLGSAKTNPIEVTEGVLQGETLSPLLFLLFICDFETFLRNKKLTGININGHADLLLLLFADDAVALANTPVELRKLLLAVDEFCETNELTINTSKTKIIDFRRNGRELNQSFSYRGQEIEKVKSYTYLGVVFSSSSLGTLATDNAIKKTRIAIGAAFQTMRKCKADCLIGKLKLFDSVTSPTLLYGSHIFGLRYLEQLETVQSEFLKRLLYLPRTAHNATTRLEFDRVKLALPIFKQALSWTIRILEMDETRLTRICFFRQLKLHKDRNGNISDKYNWITQLNSILSQIDMSHLLSYTDPAVWKSNVPVALEKFRLHLKISDLIAFQQSSTLICKPLRSISDGSAPYLNERRNDHVIRVLAQVRLASTHYLRFTIRSISYVINQKAICTICDRMEPETLVHFMLECPLYQHYRELYLQPLFIHESTNFMRDIAMINTLPMAKNVFCYVANCLKLRAFLLNE